MEIKKPKTASPKIQALSPAIKGISLCFMPTSISLAIRIGIKSSNTVSINLQRGPKITCLLYGFKKCVSRIKKFTSVFLFTIPYLGLFGNHYNK